MKHKSKDKVAPVCDNSLTGWDYAIRQAECAIWELSEKAERLRVAIQTFQEMRERGELWPGTSESENGLVGQDGDLGQSPAIQRLNR